MKNKIFVLVSTLVFLVGCGRNSNKIKLRFWNGFTGPDGRTMLQIVRKFNKENPDILVQMQRIDWGTYYNKLFVAGIGKRAPDIFVVHADSLARFQYAGFLRPIDDLVFGTNGIDVTDIDSNVWAATEIDGKHYALPLDVHPAGLYYNKKLFREAGITNKFGEPTPPTNRKEFFAALKKLKKDKNGDGKPDQWGFVFTFYPTLARTFILQWGGDLIDAKTKECTVNKPEAVAAVQFLADIINKQHLAPVPENMDGWLGFRQGKVGMVFEGIYMLADLKKQKDLDFGAAVVPVLGKKPAVWGSTHELCLSPELKGKKLKAAWKFIKFLSDNSIDWAASGQVPVRQKIRATDEFKKLKAQYTFSKEIPYLVYLPHVITVSELQEEYGIALDKAFRGRCSAQEALDEAAARYKKTVERQKKIDRKSKRKK